MSVAPDDGGVFGSAPNPHDRPGASPLEKPAVRSGAATKLFRSSLFRLATYYVLLLVLSIALITAYPPIRDALVVPTIPAVQEGMALATGAADDASAAPMFASGAVSRASTTFLVIVGAILLSLPVAWVYMWTKRLRYDPGLVRSVVILPIAVAGILLVVKNSLAIAFSLAGIVAAVRFRNTLKDPQDAVYIFLTIAIGIAAGVSALDVAFVVSITFNVAVLLMWRFDVAAPGSGRYGRTGVLSFGDRNLLVAVDPEACRLIRREAFEHAGEADADALVLVHSGGSDLVRSTVQDAFSQTTEDWRLLSTHDRGHGRTTFVYLVWLADKTTPIDLMGTLDDWSVDLPAAEYIPYRTRSSSPEPGAEHDASARREDR